MALQNEKCVLVLDEHLPLGLVANTAAILGITIGKEHPQMVGASVRDQTGSTHMGITTLPIPILKSSAEGIKDLRERLFEPEFQGLTEWTFQTWPRAAAPTMISPQRWRRDRKKGCPIWVWPSAAPKRP